MQMTAQKYGYSTTVNYSFKEALERTRKALHYLLIFQHGCSMAVLDSPTTHELAWRYKGVSQY